MVPQQRPRASRPRLAKTRFAAVAAGALTLVLAMTMNPAAVAPAAADEPVQVTVNIANKLDVALAVGPTDVDYSTFEADLRANLKARAIPVPDEDLYITAAKAVSANTTNEFQWWTYDHTIPTNAQQPTRLDTDGNGVAFKSATYPNYQAFYNYVIAQAKLGNAKTWNTANAPSVAELAKYAALEPSTTYFKNIDDVNRQYIENNAMTLRTGTNNAATGYIDSTDKTNPNFGPYSTAATANQTHPYDGNLFHMEESNGGSRMDFYGYGTNAYKDFRYLPNEQRTKKSFEFAIQEFVAYDALDGVGFFFNTDITEDNYGSGQKMSGYLLFLQYGSTGTGTNMIVYKFKDVDTKAFHNTTTSALKDYPGFTEVARGPYSGTDKYRRIKLDVYPTYAKVYYAGSPSSSAVLTTPIAEEASPVVFTGADITDGGTRTKLDQNYVASYGFGPMASYLNHSCSRPTAIAMQNISMTMDKVKTLVEVVDEPEWHDSTKKFLVNLNEETIPDFEETNITARLLNRLRNDDIYYIGWATEDNAGKSAEFLQKNDLKGTVVNMTQDDHDSRQVYAPSYAEQIQAIADEIYRQYWIENVGDVVLTTDNVVLSVTGADQTGTADAEYPDGKWTVVHRLSGADPATPPDRTGDDAVSNDDGIQPWSGVTRSDLDVQFDKVGYYDLYYRGQYLKTITSHRPPVASFGVGIDADGNATFTNTSYDPDFTGDDLTTPCSASVTTACSQWKYLNLGTDAVPVDTVPRDGVPDTLVEGDTYLVYLTVTDRYGTQTSISRQVRFVGDCEGSGCGTAAVYMAPFADFTLTPTKILPWGDNTQTVTVANRSYDPQGMPVTSAFTLTLNGAPFTGYTFAPGWEQGTLDTTGWPVGEYALSLVVANGKQDDHGADLVSAPYVLTFTIVEDHDSPTATADPGPGTYVGNTTVTVRFTDVGDAGLATQRVAVTTSAVRPDADDPAWTATSTSATRPVTVSQTGSYLHWEATDRTDTGNPGYGVFGPYTITKNTTHLGLAAAPTTVTFGTGETVTLTATLVPATPTGSVHFSVDGVYVGSGTIDNGVATLDYTPTMAGDVTLTATYDGDGSHSGSSATLSYTIERSPDVSVTFDQDQPYDKVYDGDPFELTGLDVTTGDDPSTVYEVSYEGEYSDGVAYGPTSTPPTDAGTYTVTVTTKDSRYVETTESMTFTIAKADQATLAVAGLDATYEVDAAHPPTATLSTSGGSGDGDVSYEITAQDPAGTATLSGTTVTMNTVGTFTVTATKAADRNYTATTATFEVSVVDTTVATGTITVTNSVTPVAGESAWTGLPSGVFDHFSRGWATFTVGDVADNSGETVAISYVLSDVVLTPAQLAGPGVAWAQYTAPVVRSATWKGVMYVRLVDSSNNVAYLGSSGVVVYTDVAERTASSSTTRYSTTSQTVPLTFNGSTVRSVTVTGGPTTPSMSGAYTVDYTGTTPGLTFTGSFLAGLSTGTYTFTVAYDPLGESFVSSAWNMAPASTVVTVVVGAATPTVTLTAAAQTDDALHTEDVTLTASVAGVTGGGTPTGTVSFYAVTASEVCGAGTALDTQAWNGAPVTTTVSGLAAASHTFCAVYTSADTNYTSATGTTSLQINDWITAVAVSHAPTTTTYRYGEPLDLTGGVLGLTWSDGTGATSVDFADLGATAFTGYHPNVLGDQTVTVTYAGRTATFTVTVVDYQVGVVYTAPAKTTYEWGDPLSVVGGTLAQKMASGAVQGQVTLTAAMVSGFTSTQEGAQTLMATYDWGEGSFSGNSDVTVVDPVVEIRVKKLPDKTHYGPGEPLDLTGGEIYVVKKSGTYSMSMDDAMASGYLAADESGDHTVTLVVDGKQTSFTVATVVPSGNGSTGGGSGTASGSTTNDASAVPGAQADHIVGEALAATDPTGTGVVEDAVDTTGPAVSTGTVVAAASRAPQESGDGWALSNVVLVAAGLALTAGAGLVTLRRKTVDPTGHRRRTVGLMVSAAATMIGIGVLALVLDLAHRMVFTDTWTPLLAVTFAGSLGGLVWSVRGAAGAGPAEPMATEPA